MTETQYISSSRLKFFIRLILILVILAAVVFTVYEVVQDRSNVSVGEKAPDFELKTMDGQIVKLSDLKGQGVLLNFWGTWCDPCKEEMPAINKAHKQNIKGVKILAINIQESPSIVKKFYESYHLDFTTVLDKTGKVKHKYHVSNIPSTFLIDKNGVVVKKVVGAMNSADDVVKNLKLVQP